jgi:hypothetical protein
MDKLLNKLDTNVCLKYNDTYSSVVGLFNFDISVLLNTIDNVYILYNNIRMNPALTEDIIVSIIKKLDRSQNSYINKCWLITQEFCEKYKSDFILTASEMVSNCLPVKYIIDTHGCVFNKMDYYAISKYCTRQEFEDYCKDHIAHPTIENPNMTIDWFVDCIYCYRLIDINWYEYANIRSDLFTPEVVMKYKGHIHVNNNIWAHYFKQFPVDFINANLHLKYTSLYDCIDTFKSHPGGISWYTIDKYMAVRIGEFRSCAVMVTISDTIIDLPCWFVKKYIDILSIKCHNVNAHFNYKFIARHMADTVCTGLQAPCNATGVTRNSKPAPGGREFNVSGINIVYTDMIKIRTHYITMLNDIVSVCEKDGIILDLHDTILSYC